MKAPGCQLGQSRAAQFYDFERRHNLFAATASGISCWRVMRNFLFYRHQGLPATVGSVPQSLRLFIAICAIGKLAFVLLFPPKRDFVFKGCVSALRWQIGGRWLDPAIDPILEEGYTAFKLVEQNSAAFAVQSARAAYPGHLEPSAFTFIGRVLAVLFPVKIGSFHLRVSNLLDAELDLQVAPSALRLRVSTVIWQARLYRLLLRRLRPRHVIVTDTGEFGLRLACLQMQVPFFEIQHGIFDAAHPDAIPDDISGTDGQLLIPDLLLSKGQFWIDQLAGYRHGRVATPVGSAIIDFWRNAENIGPHVTDFHVVVTTQGIAVERLIEIIKEAISQAPSEIDWRMSIKLHPVYDDIENFDLAFQDEVRVVVLKGSSEPNVYELLASSDLHVSISSACHFDALSLGRPTLMLPLQSHENLLYAVRPGGITLFSAPADIWTAGRSRNATEDCDYYSRLHYVANVVECFTGHRA